MFSGIVESKAAIARAEEVIPGKLIRIWVSRPAEFTDLKVGDSVATDGVCLTVEAFDNRAIQFALAAETLAVTNWNTEAKKVSDLVGRFVNLERSLRLGDRIHGHLVSGHVDAASKVVRVEDLGETRIIDITIPSELRGMVWKKGSWALNGVSLTVNSVDGGVASHCLIPETLSRTNLGSLQVGDLVNIEVDVFARALAQSVESYMEERAKGAKLEKENLS
jgi:riboflavin synthase